MKEVDINEEVDTGKFSAENRTKNYINSKLDVLSGLMCTKTLAILEHERLTHLY